MYALSPGKQGTSISREVCLDYSFDYSFDVCAE